MCNLELTIISSKTSSNIPSPHAMEIRQCWELRMNNICINFFLEITRGTNQKPQAKRVIIPPDDRKQLSSSNKAQKSPHSAACKVSCKGSCRWSCSGTLIGPHHVLTSAHCIDGEDIATLQVGFLERNGRLQYKYRVIFVLNSCIICTLHCAVG